MRRFRDVFQYHLNTGKHTCESLAVKSGLPVERLRAFLRGDGQPRFEEVGVLADALLIRASDLMPEASNTHNGIVYLNATDSAAGCRDVYRQADGRRVRYYTYRDTAFSRATPHARGVILDLHCTREDDVVQNNGHFQDALTLVLLGNIKGYWVDADGRVLSKILKTGHSYYARGYVPHTYRSFPNQPTGQILSFTFNHHVSGEVQKELAQLGPERAPAQVMSSNGYGNLLAGHLNNGMTGPAELARVTAIDPTRIDAFLHGDDIPTFFELDAIADALRISATELMPIVDDTQAGLLHVTLDESRRTERRLRDQDGSARYLVRDLARTREASTFRAHHMRILAGHADDANCDLYSTEHTLLFALSGSARLTWVHAGQRRHLNMSPYDSVYLEPFVRFALSSVNNAELARFQYPSLTAGSARKELFIKGPSAIDRLVEEQRAWADGQDS